MMRNRIFAVLALAVLAGGGLAYGTYNAINSQPVKTVNAPTQSVVVAAADLPLGSELKKEDLTVVNFPVGAAPEGSFAKPQDLIGRGLIVSMVKNEPFLNAKLASKEAGAGLPPVIPEGMRAVSVRVNEVIGVAGYVLPGTRVDVVATVSPTQNSIDMTSKVILTNVQVLAAGTKIERDAKDNKPIPVSVVTLLVDPGQAERLTLASTEGKIQLALRNPLDKETPATPGIRPAALLGAPATTPKAITRVVVRSAPTSNLPTVEIIRGDKRTLEGVRQE
jgi:pilus assembly protein CpaB